MSIITLITDFGYKDYFVGALKGKILSEQKEAVIVDISHEIDLFNTLEASYCIEASYSNFQKAPFILSESIVNVWAIPNILQCNGTTITLFVLIIAY